MNRFAAAFGLTVACTIFVPATSVAGARPDERSAIVLTAASAQPFVVSADAGSETRVFASVNNGSGETRTVRLGVVSDDAIAQRWVTIANTIIDIPEGETMGVDVRVAIPAEATAASHAVTITATLDGDSAPAASLALPITVSGAPKGALQIASVVRDAEDPAKLLMKVRNDGALSVTATGDLTVGSAPASTPIAVSVVVGPSTSESVVVDVGRSVKLPVDISVALRYGTDVASWSGTLRPVAASLGTTRASAVEESAQSVVPSNTAGIEPATVLLVLIVGAAIVWLLFELLASKRSPLSDAQSLVVGADAAHAALVAAAIGVQLTPLVTAIEHLAAAFTQQDVVPINTVESPPLADVQRPGDGLSIQENTMTDSETYFADEIYGQPTIVQATLRSDHVQALSEIESAASVVREAYLRPELDIETQHVIEAQLVADDAHHRAELIQEVACGLGIPKAVLLEWMPDDVFDRTEIAASAVDVVAIQRENRVLELQVAILKRAVAHFASN